VGINKYSATAVELAVFYVHVRWYTHNYYASCEESTIHYLQNYQKIKQREGIKNCHNKSTYVWNFGSFIMLQPMQYAVTLRMYRNYLDVSFYFTSFNIWLLWYIYFPCKLAENEYMLE